MKVTALRTLICDTGQGRTFLFVLVDTDEGITGVGEGSQSDQDAAVAQNVAMLADRYTGHDPFELIELRGRLLRNDRAGRAMFVATSAIEQALWDVCGKALGQPVYRLLGGPCHETILCYATMAAGLTDRSPQGLAAEAARCMAEGYAGVKVVPFRGARPTDPSVMRLGTERVAAVREAVGPDALVMIECQFAFDRATAIRVARALEPYDVFWLEAPLLWDDPDELSRLRDAVPLRIASGETMHGRRANRELIERRAVDVLQPDVKWTGGILEAKKIAAWAETYQIQIAPHNNSGPVATAASAHLAATLPNLAILEVPSRVPAWEHDLIGSTHAVQQGRVTLEGLRERPGLGISFDEDVATAMAAGR